jgi:hypothetical protein
MLVMVLMSNSKGESQSDPIQGRVISIYNHFF